MHHWFLLCLASPLALLAYPAGISGAADITCPSVCKVLTLTPQEEQALLGPNMILDAAAYARRMELGQVADYFRRRIQEAPPGEVKPPPESEKK